MSDLSWSPSSDSLSKLSNMRPIHKAMEFSLRTLISIVSGIDLHFVSRLGRSSLTNPIETETQSLYWSMIETGIAVIAACLPIIHSLFPPNAFKSLARGVRTSLSYPASLVRTSKGSQSGGTERPFMKLTTDERHRGHQKSIELTQAAGYI